MQTTLTAGSAEQPRARQAAPAAGSARAALGLPALTALVIGSTIGSGIFSLPQNMAAGAGAAAVVIGWLVTGAGMLALALVYQALARRQPSLDNGVFAYARAGGGELAGFSAAWGYWLSAWIGNVGYLVIFFAALGHFFPVFGEGNNTVAIGAASVLLWGVHALVLSGVRTAAMVNMLVTVAKVVPLAIFVVLAAAAFDGATFAATAWGTPELGPVFDQVKSTMLVTVWVFIGIEGASVYSARARRREHVGRATVIGFVFVLLMLMAVSLLSLGVLRQPELAALKNPSMKGVLEHLVGPWGATLVSVGLLVSVGGALLAWILLAAESLFVPAGERLMPQRLATQNEHKAPAAALWLTNGMTQALLLLALWSNATYLALIMLATSMILVPYLFSGAYAVQSAWRRRGYAGEEAARTRDLLIAGVATLYCGWLLYAAGPKYLLLSALLYAPGLVMFALARRERGLPMLRSGGERAAAVVLFGAAVAAAWGLATGGLAL